MNSNLFKWKKGNHKYYQAHITKDMFGDWLIICTWGSQKTRHGNKKNHCMTSIEEVMQFIEALNKRRLQRGYLND